MGNDVFANGREISCKAADGKSICAFPDVCFTPPQTPATPPGVPLPYPNTGFAKDTTKGSKSVKITNKEVMLKNKSHFKTSTGDEAGCAPKKGFVTSKIKGKIYFTAWSMDVKFEGKNVVRHMDLTTHNHASQGPNSPPWLYMDSASMPEGDCKEKTKKTEECMEKHIKKNTHQKQRVAHRKDGVTIKQAKQGDDADVNWDKILKEDDFYNKKGAQESFCADTPGCKETLNCSLVPYNFFCCDDKTGHHIIPAHCFMPPGERQAGTSSRYPGCENYDDKKAPCICLDGQTKSDTGPDGLKEHGRVHEIVDATEDGFMKKTPAVTPTGKPKMSGGERVMDVEAGTWNFEQANEAGSDAVSQVKNCDKECLKMQCEVAHQKMGLDVGEGKSEKLMLRADSHGSRTPDGFVPGGATSSATAG